MDSNEIIAPFVLKTYHMVTDPSLDRYIHWGTANNTFIVVDPLDFSKRLLPVNFKHNNFSSFVRQLNTYGFKKVDPDRWEFANEWFLKGQTHLLKNIGRKRQNNNNKYNINNNNSNQEEDDEDEMSVEIAKLKEQQKVLEEELDGMNKRLQATERRPDQMMTLLHKVAHDPQILPRMMLKIDQRLVDKKRQRILITPPSSQGWSAEGYYGRNWQSSSTPDTPSMPRPPVNIESESFSRYVNNTDGSGDTVYFEGFSSESDVKAPAAFPFSLFGGGF